MTKVQIDPSKLVIRPAVPSECDRVLRFYDVLVESGKDMEYHPKWIRGVYPDDAYLIAAVEQGEMVLVFWEEAIIGAMVVNHHANEQYDAVAWPTDAAGDAVTVIHIFGVLPQYTRQGVAGAMVDYVIRQAAAEGGRVVRLDVLTGNYPACRLYEKAGFRHVERRNMYYVDTGWHDFELYEYVLSK